MQNTSILNHLKNPMKMHKSSQTFIVKVQSVPFFVKKNFLVVNIDCVLEMDLTVEHLIQNWLVLKDAILSIFNPSTPKLQAG